MLVMMVEHGLKVLIFFHFGGLLLIMTTVLLPETLRKVKPEDKCLVKKGSQPGALQNMIRDFKPMFLMLRD